MPYRSPPARLDLLPTSLSLAASGTERFERKPEKNNHYTWNRKALVKHIRQILALPETRTAPEFAVSLHLRDRPWIGGVLVDRERARCAAARAPCGRTASPQPYRAVQPTGSRSSARGCPPPDKDTSKVPSPGHRSRPPARSRCSSADAGGSASQVPRHRPGSNGRSLCGRPRRRGRGASVRDRGS